VNVVIPQGVLELKAILEPMWPEIRPSGLVCEVDPGAPPAGVVDQGGQPAGDTGGGEPAAAPAGADPRVLEQMQSQLQQFGGVVGQMAEYLPAMQQIAEGQNGGAQEEPSIEDLASQFFGEPSYGQEPVGQGEPRFDPYTGEPIQQQQAQGMQGDPNQLIDLFRQVVRSEVSPLQERLQREDQQRQQQAWNTLYDEFPQFQDPQQAPQIAARVADAARLFGRDDAEASRFANDPQFVRMVHLSSITEQRGQGETVATSGDGTQPIESGGGASVPGQGAVDEGDAIVSAGRGGGGGAGSHFR
jgi:hypothetical protein